MRDQSISVVIPAFNARRYISAAIASAWRQTVRPCEILVVDDGSTDGTAELVSRYVPLVRLISQANAGVSVARNLALSQARGRFVALLDADDLCSPHRFEKQLTALAQAPDAIACYTGYWKFEGYASRSWHLADPGLAGLEPLDFASCCRLHGTSVMFRRAQAAGLQFPVGMTHGEDLIFTALLRTRGAFVVCPQPLYGYRSHPGQTTRRSSQIDSFEQRLRWLREQGATVFAGCSRIEVERRIWLGLAQTMEAAYWSRNRRRFLDIQAYLRDNWPRDVERPNSLEWRYYPEAVWEMKDMVDRVRTVVVDRRRAGPLFN